LLKDIICRLRGRSHLTAVHWWEEYLGGNKPGMKRIWKKLKNNWKQGVFWGLRLISPLNQPPAPQKAGEPQPTNLRFNLTSSDLDRLSPGQLLLVASKVQKKLQEAKVTYLASDNQFKPQSNSLDKQTVFSHQHQVAWTWLKNQLASFYFNLSFGKIQVQYEEPFRKK